MNRRRRHIGRGVPSTHWGSLSSCSYISQKPDSAGAGAAMKKRLPKSRTIHKGLNLAATVKKGYANEPPVRTKAVWFGTTTGGVHPCASMQKRTARGVLAGVLTS